SRRPRRPRPPPLARTLRLGGAPGGRGLRDRRARVRDQPARRRAAPAGAAGGRLLEPARRGPAAPLSPRAGGPRRARVRRRPLPGAVEPAARRARHRDRPGETRSPTHARRPMMTTAPSPTPFGTVTQRGERFDLSFERIYAT